jgi:hypothetical protein
VSPWKVILATLVIFCSGLAVGALIVKKKSRPAPVAHSTQRGHTNAPSAWNLLQKELVRKMDRELDLSAEQRVRIEKILKESQERTKQIRERIAPEMREELKDVREQIRTELDPEQQEKFEKAMKVKQRKPDEQGDESRRKKDGSRRQPTNAPSTNIEPSTP